MSMFGKFKITVDTTTLANGDSLAAYLTSAAGILLSHSTVTPKIHAAFTFAPADVNTTDNTITESNHQLETGDIVQFSTSGTLPAGLSTSTDYYVIRVDVNTIKVASSLDNAETGTAVDITDQGTGTHTATEQENPVKVLNTRLAGLEKIEDQPHVGGDRGLMALAVRQDTEGALVDADGDYAPLQVDSLGRLRVNADINVNNDFVYAEDSGASSGDLGASVLLVRQDTLATSTSADGDYGHFKSTDLGELYVKDSSANTTLSSLLTELQSITHAEDVAHVSGDAGIMPLAVRNDTLDALAGADGDYAPLQVDANGSLYVVGTLTFLGQFAEDSAHTTADTGLQMLAVRKDAQGTNVSADGDYSSLLTWSEGSLKVVDVSNGSLLQQQVTVGATAVALPTTALSNRKSLMIQNAASSSVWVGSSTVTTTGATTGIEVPKGGFMELEVGPAVTVYAIAEGAGRNVNVLETA